MKTKLLTTLILMPILLIAFVCFSDTTEPIRDYIAYIGIDFGHLSDTTVTRVSAGDIQIETKKVYRVDGNDVDVADGGTGVSTLTHGGVLLGSGAEDVNAMAVLTDGQMIVGDGTTNPVAESGATLRTSIGVGTGDTPQFTGIALGHDLNTTILRPAAGRAQIAGVEIAKGTPTDGHIPVGDGTTFSNQAKLYYDMQDYLPASYVTDATVNYSSYLQTAMNDANTAGGGTIMFPAGNYQIGTTIDFGTDYITIQGAARHGTRLTVKDCNAFTFDSSPGVYRSSTLKDLYFVGSTAGYVIDILGTNTENLVDLTLTDLYMDSVGILYAHTGTDLTGWRMSNCHTLNAPYWGIYIEGAGGTELNKLHFVDCWFDAGTLGAWYINNANRYCVVESCIFESNFGSYTIQMEGGDYTWSGCLFFNNGADESPVTGADIFIQTGGVPVNTFTGCNFSTPNANADEWYTIKDQSTNSFITIDGCYATVSDANQLGFYDPTGNYGIKNVIIKNSIFQVGTAKEMIAGGDVRTNLIVTNCIGFNPYSFEIDEVSAYVQTTDATATQIWGGTYYGPYYSYPDPNATIIYKATVVGRNTDNSIYMARDQWAMYEIEETSANIYNYTLIASGSKDYQRTGALDSAFGIVNDPGATAAVTFTITGVAANTISWSAKISASAAITPSTF